MKTEGATSLISVKTLNLCGTSLNITDELDDPRSICKLVFYFTVFKDLFFLPPSVEKRYFHMPKLMGEKNTLFKAWLSQSHKAIASLSVE